MISMNKYKRQALGEGSVPPQNNLRIIWSNIIFIQHDSLHTIPNHFCFFSYYYKSLSLSCLLFDSLSRIGRCLVSTYKSLLSLPTRWCCASVEIWESIHIYIYVKIGITVQNVVYGNMWVQIILTYINILLLGSAALRYIANSAGVTFVHREGVWSKNVWQWQMFMEKPTHSWVVPSSDIVALLNIMSSTLRDQYILGDATPITKFLSISFYVQSSGETATKCLTFFVITAILHYDIQLYSF